MKLTDHVCLFVSKVGWGFLTDHSHARKSFDGETGNGNDVNLLKLA